VNGIIEHLEAARKEKAFGLHGLYYYSYSLSCRWASWIGVSIIDGLAQGCQRRRIIIEKRI
jgi:hypothetical protein